MLGIKSSILQLVRFGINEKRRKEMKCKDAPELAALTKVVGSRKRSLTFTVCEEVTLYGRYWSGGTRHEYFAVNIETKKVIKAPDCWNPLRNVENVTVPIPEGIVIVEAGTFCGKPSVPHIYINPINTAKLLPA